MRSEKKYYRLLTLLFFAVSINGMLHHELWLDEAHHWLLARDSVSLLDLFQNTRIEGHPVLWNVLLYFITRFSVNPLWMGLLHASIATLTVGIFLRRAPFHLILKTLIIFGYFFIFEYNLICRNYILGILFLFLACTAFEKRKEKFLRLTFFLALAANVHLMFGVIAVALMLTILLENFQNRQLFLKQYSKGYMIFGIGMILLAIQMQTTDSAWFFDGLGDIAAEMKLSKGFISLFKGLVLVPDFRTIHFWNTNLIVNESRTLASVLGLLVYFVPLVLFFKNRKTLFFVYSALAGTQIFFFITQRGATRFHGMTYIIIITALWINMFFGEDNYRLKHLFYRMKADLLQKPIIYGIVGIHFLSGITAYAIDCRFPFTASKDTVDFLNENKSGSGKITTFSCDGTPLSPYLERKIYFLASGGEQSYCVWSNIDQSQYTQENITDALTSYLDEHKNCVYISSYPFLKCELNAWKNVNDKFKIRLLKKFDYNILENGNFYVYECVKYN